MAQESIMGGLFGITPQSYEEDVYNRALKRAQEFDAPAQLQASFAQLGRGIGGALGAEDPQLRLISARNAIMKGVDLTDPEALQQVSSRLAQIGDMQGAYGVAELAQKRAESSSAINLREAQAIKATMLPKLTGDERYIAQLRIVENQLRQGKTPSDDELSTANIASQMLSRPRSFFDQASGQTVVIPATDPSKAFPLTFKQFSGTEAQATTTAPTLGAPTQSSITTATKPGMPTTGVATVQKVTEGNLPSGSQTAIADIDANLTKLSQSGPELNQFLKLIKEKKVRYDLTSNAYDIIGAIVPPAFRQEEFGDQVQKDTIERALTERVNTLLIMAKGTQTEGDATRAKTQIASSTTYLSQKRMEGAIEGLINAENKLKNELEAKRQTLQGRGQSTIPSSSVGAPKTKSGELSREEKIDIFIRANDGKPTRQQAETHLKSKGLLN
jgi:hypothetical protein